MVITMMNSFKSYHPVVNFTYFVFVLVFAMVFINPVCLIISLGCGFAFSVMLKGARAVKSNLLYMLPVLIFAAVINPAFNHQGVTILTYLPSGNPLTLESIVYGFAAGIMLASVICWFSCYNEVMTSDKFIYLFGRVIPSMSLVLSMALRFVPRFKEQLKTISDAQRCIGRDISSGTVIHRAKNGLNILSIMVTWSLENAAQTADSMKSRGYGLEGRTAYSIFIFSKRDAAALTGIGLLGVYVLVGMLSGAAMFSYFPSMKGAVASVYGVSVFAAYFALCLVPVVIEIREVCKWNAIRRKV